VTPDGSVIADGTSEYTATVTARDANGNGVEGAVIGFDTPENVTVSSETCSTGENGTCAVRLTSTIAGTYTVTARLGGDQIGSAASLTFVAGDPSLTNSTVTASRDTIKADGNEESAITVRLSDEHGNPVASGSKKVTIATDAGRISDTTNNGDGTHSATLTATTGGTATISFAIDGNLAQSTTTVKLTAVPAAPIVHPSNGSVVNGSAEPNAVVTITGVERSVIGTGTASATGAFSIVPDPRPAHGDIITAYATNSEGNTSPGTSVTIDASAPAAPIVDPTDGSVVTGHAEPATTVTIENEDGNVIGSGPAGADGSFSIVPSPRPGNGDVLTLKATDLAGNISPGTAVTVKISESSAPAATPGADPTHNGDDASLAKTGSDIAPIWQIALWSLLALALGLLIVALAARRRKDESA
jgi:hypothetical protein